MRIGIDAKWFFEGPPSGKVVITNIVEQLVKVNQQHELIFFIDKKRVNDFPFKNHNIKTIAVWTGNNLLSNVFSLPVKARKNVDVLVYQNFPSLNTPYKQIAYIHDIIFLTHPDFYSLPERIYFRPLKFLAKRSDYICTVSNSEVSRIEKYYNIPKSKIDYVHHGVNPIFKPKTSFSEDSLNSIKTKYNLPDNYLLYVGRLNIRKNVFNLLEGFARSEYRKNKLVIVGGYNWKMKDVRRTVERLNLAGDIIFTGPIYGDDLAAVFAMAKIFCFPSYEESFGLPPLEAMACGIPVIVSDSSSLPEVCGEAGTYVNALDPDDIAAKIDILMNDEKLYQQKKELALKQAAKFTWEASARKLIEICERVAAEK